jgi:hypothetical protein
MRDAFVLQQCEERRASGDAIHEGPPVPAAFAVGVLASWLIRTAEINGRRSWLPCAIATRAELQASPRASSKGSSPARFFFFERCQTTPG